MRSSILISLALATYVSAHGWVQSITVGGKTYQGNEPTENTGGSSKASVIRQISTPNPVKGADNKNLACGQDAKPAKEMATANPGDTVKIQWTSASGNWFHNVGPMLTYMASCGSSSCSDFDDSEAEWFKIDQVGANSDGTWAQAKLDSGAPAVVTIPESLKAGNYLMRHEIMALHNAAGVGGAEFYPSCAQLKVGGDGSAVSSDDELVKIPGAYKDTDKGIQLDVYTNFVASKYQFPGPKVAKLVGSDSSSGSSSDSGSDSSSSGSNNGSSGSSSPSSSSSASAEEPSSTSSSPSNPASTPASTPAASAPEESSNSSGTKGSDSGSKSDSSSCRKRRSNPAPRMQKKSSTLSARNESTSRSNEVEDVEARAPTQQYVKNLVSVHKPRHVSRVMRSSGGGVF